MEKIRTIEVYLDDKQTLHVYFDGEEVQMDQIDIKNQFLGELWSSEG